MTKGTKPMPNDNGTVEDRNIDDEGLDIDPSKVNTDEPTPDEVQRLQKTAQTALAQKDHWRKRAIDPVTGKSYKELLDEAKAKPAEVQPQQPSKPTTTTEGDDELKKRLTNLETLEEKRKFGYANKLSPEETDKLFALAQGQGVKPDEVLNDEFWKQGLTAMRKKAQAESGIPTPSRRSPQVEGKTIDDMKEPDRKKNWSKLTGAQKE